MYLGNNIKMVDYLFQINANSSYSAIRVGRDASGIGVIEVLTNNLAQV